MIKQFFHAVFHELFRAKTLYNVVACLILIIVITVGYFWQENYASHASITIGQRSGIGALPSGVDQQSLANRLSNTFSSRTFQLQLLETLGELSENDDVEVALRKLNQQASLVLENSTLARLSYVSHDPTQAQIRVTLILQVLLDTVQPKGDTAGLQIVATQIREQKQALVKKITALDEQVNSLRVSSADVDNDSVKQRIASIRKDLEDVEVSIDASNAKISGIVGKLAQEGRNQNSQNQLNALNARRDYLLTRLNTLKQQSSYSESQAASLQREIDGLSREIKAFSVENAGNLLRSIEQSKLFQSHLRNSLSVEEVELAALLSRQESLRKLLQRSRSEATSDESDIIAIEQRSRELQSLRTQLDALKSEEEKNRADQAAAKAATPNYLVLDQPNLPQNYYGLGVLEFLILGPVLAVLLPFMLASLIVILDSRIRTTRQISMLIPSSVSIVSVPHYNSPKTLRLFHRAVFSLVVWGIFVFSIYFTLGFIGLKH